MIPAYRAVPKRGGSLSGSLDKEVQLYVQRLSQEQYSGEYRKISDQEVLQHIKNAKRPIARKPNQTLLDSIDRVLSVLKEEEEESDSGAEIEAQQEPAPQEIDVMNRKLRESMKKNALKQAKPRENGLEDRSRPVEDDTESTAPVHGERKAKKPRESEPDAPRKKQKVEKDKDMHVAPKHVSLADLGGMESVIKEFEENLLLPLKIPSHYLQRGLRIPRGILLHGPPGCGKTMLCEAVAAELDLPFVQISAPSIVSGMSGESEKAIRDHFATAKKLAPCLMFIDEIDTITPKRETAQREMERRMVGQLLTCMDELALEKNDGKPVIVLAATNRPDSLDPALRRAGRFDTEINVGVPNAPVREQILKAQTRKTAVHEDVDFAKLAKMTPGFVGADLESLVLKAGNVSNLKYLNALKERAQALDLETAIQPETDTMDVDGEPGEQAEQESIVQLSASVASFRALNKLLTDQNNVTDIPDDPITMADFEMALLHVQPSAKREGFATIPETTWENIGALESVRLQLVNAVVKPIQSPEKYEKFGISIPAGVLLWGPPGCGKTLLAKAVANESKANFISVKGPELLNKYVGESERAVRQVFFRARSSVPCVIFFDELDALVPKRDDALSDASARVVNTLLTELDGISNRSGIYVIAATNRPDMIDPAMLRPGRLGKHLYVGPPGPAERVEILTTLMKKMPADESKLAEFARRCDHFTGADLSNLAYEAAQSAVQRDADEIEFEDFEVAIGSVKPSVSEKELRKFELLKESF